MKKFALFAMLICAGLITFGCGGEKKKDAQKDTTKIEKTEGGEKTPEKTEEPAK
jgi:hypothetical protein